MQFIDLWRIPKVELHAHLNGCARETTIRELASSVSDGTSPSWTSLATKRTLDQCFELFAAIHDVTTDLRHVRRIAAEAIEDFERDGVIYVELRTTPKCRPERDVTKESYMRAVLNGRDDFYRLHPASTIHVRFILSIDRRESGAEAMETVMLARQLKSEGVVGIDLSGNPRLGRFGEWREALEVARSVGLKLTFHAGEVVDYEETMQLVSFGPDRLGHLCFATAEILEELRRRQIPLELCLTSNLLTKSVASLDDHHLLEHFRAGHPVVICTDDPSVFGTTSTQEYLLAAELLKLDRKGLFGLVVRSIEFCFCDDETKATLRKTMRDFELECLD